MAFKFSDIFQYFTYLPYVDKIVAIVHDVTDKDSSRDKVADVIEDVLDTLAPLVKSKNPALAGELDSAIAVVKQALANWQGQPAPAPVPVPPAPPAEDPTSKRYSEVADAKAAVSAQYPLVIQYSDGQYGVWPVLSLPAGATRVP